MITIHQERRQEKGRMVWCAGPEGRYIGPIPENELRWIVRTAASQKVSQVAEENLENIDNNCKQKQTPEKERS